MKRIFCVLAVCMLMAAMTVHVWADTSVQSMISGLPTVEEFRNMDSEARLEAYNRTQAAYDAYMALSEEARAEISGAEEVFEALFGHFNSLVMPIEAAEQEAPAAEKDRTATVLSGAATLAVVIVILRFLNRKKK